MSQTLPRVGEKEAVVLRLIRDGNRYGLEIVRASEGALQRATIYVMLQRLEDDKRLIKSRLEDGEGRGPQRRVYELTALGQRTLHAHTAAQVTFAEWEPAQ